VERRREGEKGNGASVELNTGVLLCLIAAIHDPVLPFFIYPDWSCQRHTDKNFQKIVRNLFLRLLFFLSDPLLWGLIEHTPPVCFFFHFC
jgi:hypothetical protein